MRGASGSIAELSVSADLNDPQRAHLARAFGSARAVWNDALRLRRDAYDKGLPYPSATELSRQVIAQAKQTPQRAWLCEVSAVVLQQSLRDLETAYSNFFISKGSARKGPSAGPPRMKRRQCSQKQEPTRNRCTRRGRRGRRGRRESPALTRVRTSRAQHAVPLWFGVNACKDSYSRTDQRLHQSPPSILVPWARRRAVTGGAAR
ncbi:helix-turn-helix domain-containing protein [Streptomyces monashensis]|uniref:helix-turn-helix domain-containing protein n=1 Tax=Streptomyces monashensis TaxID=1678012 RepID=UPI000D1A9317